jgi:hypothetical protein
MASMAEQTEVLVWVKTARFSGVVITCSDHSSWHPRVSVRVLTYSDQDIDWSSSGSRRGSVSTGRTGQVHPEHPELPGGDSLRG